MNKPYNPYNDLIEVECKFYIKNTTVNDGDCTTLFACALTNIFKYEICHYGKLRIDWTTYIIQRNNFK